MRNDGEPMFEFKDEELGNDKQETQTEYRVQKNSSLRECCQITDLPVVLFFEPGATEHEEEYKKIFEEYKDLVDSMLSSYMDDIGITPEQFQKACDESAAAGLHVRFQQTLFEQVWAANDYEIFKRMMVQKNLELQLQALELIQQRCGVMPQSLLPSDGEDSLCTDEEVKVMEQVFRRSIEDYDASKEQLDTSTREIERSLATSTDEHQRLEAECKREKALLHSALHNTIDRPATQHVPAAEPLVDPEKKAPVPAGAEVHSEELALRQQYLRQQRDKLLALKKREREKQLAAAEVRPRSARAAQTALSGQLDDTARNLHVRRALAERLKTEVVGHL